MALWPSRTEISLTDSATQDMLALVELADRLPQIIDISKEQSPEFSGTEVVRRVSEKSGIDFNKLLKIFNALENIKKLSEDFGGADRTVAQLELAVNPELRAQIEEKNESILAALRLYDDNNPVSISYKAQKITYLRDKLFHDVEIITDARPVFDAEGERIIEMIITHTLVITYLTRAGWERIHIALDAADVLSLRKAADRAIVKARSLKSALETKWKTEVLRDDAGS